MLSSLNESMFDLHFKKIKDSIVFLLTRDKDFEKAITYSTNNEKRVATRFQSMEKMLVEATK